MGKFLSTPSARRATLAGVILKREPGISIHALCEEGDQIEYREGSAVYISIHALCEEGDPDLCESLLDRLISIHALCEEGDYHLLGRPDMAGAISIHALCEEGDDPPCIPPPPPRYFYPRPLRGGRPPILWPWRWHRRFLSTPSARRATGARR